MLNINESMLNITSEIKRLFVELQMIDYGL